jgi:hypothetical protein
MSSRFYSLYKGAVLAFVLFFASWNAEASCFSRQELYRMQTSSLEDIQAFLNGLWIQEVGVHKERERKGGCVYF